MAHAQPKRLTTYRLGKAVRPKAGLLYRLAGLLDSNPELAVTLLLPTSLPQL